MKVKFIPFLVSYYPWNTLSKIYFVSLLSGTLTNLFTRDANAAITLADHWGLLICMGLITALFWGVCIVATIPSYLSKCWEYRGYVTIKSWPKYKAYIWSPKQLAEQKRYFEGFPKEKEIIVASAIKAINGDVYSVMKPGRHHHCITLMWEKDASEMHISGNTCKQGFMTNTNRYIGRREARALAVANGQALYIHHPDEIFSENLWTTPEDMTEPSEYHPRNK